MRVLHVVTLIDHEASYGGPVSVAIGHCKALKDMGHDADIVAGWRGLGTPPDSLQGVRAYLVPVRALLPFSRYSTLFSWRYIRTVFEIARQYDIIHVHLARDLIPLSASWIARLLRVPFFAQTHGMIRPSRTLPKRLIDFLLTRPTVRHARCTFNLTDSEHCDLRAALGAGFDIAQLRNGVSVPATPTQGSTPQGEQEIIFVGRLHPRKRVMDFARCAEIVHQRGFNVRFVVVGPDDGELQSLTAFINASPVRSNFLAYEGALAHGDVLERLATASIFVLPSVDEPFPMALLEAMSLGMPSICTVKTGIADVLSQTGGAIVVEPGAQNLAEAVIALLSSPMRYRELSFSALRAVDAEFSLGSVVEKLEAHYLHAMEATHASINLGR